MKNVLALPIRLLQRLEKFFYRLRDFIWDYPDQLFLGEKSATKVAFRGYQLLRPFSHFIAAVVVIGVVVMVLNSLDNYSVLAQGRKRLLEAVVMGTDAAGNIQRLSKVNPLVTSAIQLEKDLSELIYQPLVRYEQDGDITPVLAESVVRIEEGSNYVFLLRRGVLWHDGQSMNIGDVLATLDLVNGLDPNKYDNTYVKAIQQMAWERFSDNGIQVCTVTTSERERWQNDELSNPCSGTSGDKPILSNFLELISIKIMPAHLIGELNSLTIDAPGPQINQFPVGTGPFRFVRSSENSILLSKSLQYYGETAQIDEIEFRLFADEEEAARALRNGEVHTFATVSTISINTTNDYPNITINKSPASRNQYWAMYFNLRKNPSGEPLAPAFFQDVNVRRAIAMGIDRTRIIEALANVGEIALGPIDRTSDFFNPNVNWGSFNSQEAIKLLEKAGWIVGPDGIRVKEGQRLSFKLSYARTFDREQTVSIIKQSLQGIGVEVIPEAPDTRQLVDEVVLGKQFETLLYGMHTFIDPDRYELFYSKESTGLNLAGYEGAERTVKIEGGKTVRLSKVDRLLELGRSYDPLAAKDKRRETYAEFQQLLAADMPVIFLYRPQFIYYANKRLQDTNIEVMNSLEDRFLNITAWMLE